MLLKIVIIDFLIFLIFFLFSISFEYIGLRGALKYKNTRRLGRFCYKLMLIGDFLQKNFLKILFVILIITLTYITSLFIT